MSGIGTRWAQEGKKAQRPPVARRLARVFKTSGAKDLQAFYDQIADGQGKGFLSYAAVLTYHRKPYREPPLAYLTRIVEVFPFINPDWLFMGRGEPTRGDEQARRVAEVTRLELDPVREAFEAALPGLKPWGLAVESLGELWQLIVESPVRPNVHMDEIVADAKPVGTDEAGRPHLDITDGQRRFELAIAKRLVDNLRSSLGALGLEPVQLQSDTLRETYVVQWCQAHKAAWLSATMDIVPLSSRRHDTDMAPEPAMVHEPAIVHEPAMVPPPSVWEED